MSSRIEEPAALILGTAGHIDHGKTALVKALTGIDADRLPEEKARGMTIDLGFAYLDAGGVRIGVVDVPGHERFVRTMAAGASGVDVALIVVAADDSVMPQTREHIEILDLLGVSLGVVAITKCDLVDEETIEIVGEEVSDLLDGTGLAECPAFPVSSTTGAGLTELRDSIVKLARTVSARDVHRPFRMHIDRSFSIQGRGTVVTGTVVSGEVRTDEQVELLPEGRLVRAREMQSHGAECDQLVAGQRGAINLAAVKADEAGRGDVLAGPGYYAPTSLFDVELRLLDRAGLDLKNYDYVRLCLGTRETMARVVLLEGQGLSPGEVMLAQLRLEEPMVGDFRQRFIVRDQTASRTIGGGRILRPIARKIAAKDIAEVQGLRALLSDDESERTAEAIRHEWFCRLSAGQLGVRSGVAKEIGRVIDRLADSEIIVRYPGAGGETLMHKSRIDELGGWIRRFLDRYHRQFSHSVGIPRTQLVARLSRRCPRPLTADVLERLHVAGVFGLRGDVCSLPDFQPSLSDHAIRLKDKIVAEIDAAEFQPPAIGDLKCAVGTSPKTVAELAAIAEADGEMLSITDGIYLSMANVEQLKARVGDLIRGQGPATVSEIRASLESTRKYVVPICEYLDRVGFTIRNDDRRVLSNDSNA
jgi:selenocysteine-specific elongation factor